MAISESLARSFARKVLNEDHPTEDLAGGLTLKALADSSPELVATLGFKLEIQ
jgi:hypothetical protein